jgi:hypothetical protein
MDYQLSRKIKNFKEIRSKKEIHNSTSFFGLTVNTLFPKDRVKLRCVRVVRGFKARSVLIECSGEKPWGILQ